ncbi:hypothetical protein P7H17_00010 [Paenibacillus larvae]|nr:hypothetical protein [Paenibacillus larvae]MDT2284828.1 hypothetical protein [Paenibacillus larvae]
MKQQHDALEAEQAATKATKQRKKADPVQKKIQAKAELICAPPCRNKLLRKTCFRHDNDTTGGNKLPKPYRRTFWLNRL